MPSPPRPRPPAAPGGGPARAPHFPVAPPASELPEGYAAFLADLKTRVERERLRVVVAANSALVLLYWDLGKAILDRQAAAGWGAKVIDRLASDLAEAYPDMKGWSPRNLKYMRAFAAAWPDHAFVQQAAAQIPWAHSCMLLDRFDDPATRAWYTRQTLALGGSRSILSMQIKGRAHEWQELRIEQEQPASRLFAVPVRVQRSQSAQQLGVGPGMPETRARHGVELAVQEMACVLRRYRRQVGQRGRSPQDTRAMLLLERLEGGGEAPGEVDPFA